MNVTFHMLSGIGSAALLSHPKADIAGWTIVIGFGADVCFHGVLDYVPHSYPIRSAVDVVLALALFGAAFLLVGPRSRLLVAACCIGSILPDLIDLTPGILNRHVGLYLPEMKFFPWHWRRYSGSIYDGTRGPQSLAAHLLVLGVALILIWRSGLFFAVWSSFAGRLTNSKPKA